MGKLEKEIEQLVNKFRANNSEIFVASHANNSDECMTMYYYDKTPAFFAGAIRDIIMHGMSPNASQEEKEMVEALFIGIGTSMDESEKASRFVLSMFNTLLNSYKKKREKQCHFSIFKERCQDCDKFVECLKKVVYYKKHEEEERESRRPRRKKK